MSLGSRNTNKSDFSYMSCHTIMTHAQQVQDDSEQLKLEISQLKEELKAKSDQLEQLNKVSKYIKKLFTSSKIISRTCTPPPPTRHGLLGSIVTMSET